MCAYIAEHNLPFTSTLHLSPLLPRLFPDSQIARTVCFKPSKAKAIILNVLGAQQLDDVCRLLRFNKFSICIDESTDVSTTKVLAVVSRVWCYSEADGRSRVRDIFLTMMDVKDASAKGLYDLLVSFFVHHRINYKRNLVGFSADGANVMTALLRSVAALLKIDCPLLKVNKCVSHCLAKASSEACKSIPQWVEDVVRSIYNYIGNSPKRLNEFKTLQEEFDETPYRVLKLSQTRWLSLEMVVNRVLQRVDLLKLYFQRKTEEDHRDLKAREILNGLQMPSFSTYLEVLKNVLAVINVCNLKYQRESPCMIDLYGDITNLMKYFADRYMNLNATNNTINPQDHAKYKNVLDVDLGEVGENTARTLSNDALLEVKQTWQKFYIAVVEQLQKRFNTLQDLAKKCSVLTPQNIHNRTITISDISALVDEMGCFNAHEKRGIVFDWQQLIELQNLPAVNMKTEDFWENIFDKNNENILINLHSLVDIILLIPTSSANVERVFSSMNLIKTRIRNSLKTANLSKLMHAKLYVTMNFQCCIYFKGSMSLYNRYAHLYDNSSTIDDLDDADSANLE